MQFGYLPQPSTLKLGLSPGVQNFWNTSGEQTWDSSLEFARLEITATKESARIHRLLLFGLDTFIAARPFEEPLVRYIDLGWTDWHDLIGHTQRQLALRIGSGWAFQPLLSLHVGLIPFAGLGHYENVDRSAWGLELGARLRATWAGPSQVRANLTIEHLILNPGTFSDLVQLDVALRAGSRWSIGPSMTILNHDKILFGAMGSIRF
jgi:hypothetical protein